MVVAEALWEERVGDFGKEGEVRVDVGGEYSTKYVTGRSTRNSPFSTSFRCRVMRICCHLQTSAAGES